MHTTTRRVVARARRAAVCLLLTLVAMLPVACGRSDEPQVVLYVSVDEHLARQVVRVFEEQTGIRVRLVGDTEAKKTTGLVERLRSERDNPQADVFWSSEPFMTIGLADDGVLARYVSEATSDWPAAHRGDESRWYAFAARARVIAYAPDRVAAADAPVAWTDLARRMYRGRLVMADPRFGTTGGHLGAMKAYWDRAAMPGYYQAFLLGLRDNDVRLLPSGNAGVVRAILDGEADVGLTDSDDVWAAQARGSRIAMVFPSHTREDEPGNGTLLIPNTVGMVAGAPDAENAGRLIDFLLSPQVERMLAESTSRNIPLRAALAAEFPELAVDDPLAVDMRRAAAMRSEAVAMAMRTLTATSEPHAPDESGR